MSGLDTIPPVLLARLGKPNSRAIDGYVADGGYASWKSVLAGLKSVEAVTRPEPRTDLWRLTVRPASDEANVRQAILAAALEHGLHLTSLRPIVPSLDDIYRTALERRGMADTAVGRGAASAGGRTAA